MIVHDNYVWSILCESCANYTVFCKENTKVPNMSVCSGVVGKQQAMFTPTVCKRRICVGKEWRSSSNKIICTCLPGWNSKALSQSQRLRFAAVNYSCKGRASRGWYSREDQKYASCMRREAPSWTFFPLPANPVWPIVFVLPFLCLISVSTSNSQYVHVRLKHLSMSSTV